MPSPLIELNDARRSFSQQGAAVEVLRGVDLRIERGEFAALQGASGSGKSTLLHVLGLLDTLSSGRYLLDGQDVSGLTDDQRSERRNSHIGFVFQSFYLVPYISALDNVMLPGLYGPEASSVLRERALELLDLVGLADRAHFRPGQLSGGQQQRVALARALVNRPALVMADEPTGQLDSATSAEIMELLHRIHGQGATILVVTHDAEVAGHASRVLHMADGRLRG